MLVVRPCQVRWTGSSCARSARRVRGATCPRCRSPGDEGSRAMNGSTTTIRPRRWLRQVLLLLVLALEAGWLAAWSVALGGWIDANARGPVLGILPLVGLLV